MKRNILHSCGHYQERDFTEEEIARNLPLFLEKRGSCRACYIASQAPKKEKEFEEAREQEKSEDWLPLEGTEKQVKWATMIRYRFVKWLEEETEKQFKEKGNTPGVMNGHRLLEWAKASIDSGYWIGKREYFAPDRFLEEYANNASFRNVLLATVGLTFLPAS